MSLDMEDAKHPPTNFSDCQNRAGAAACPTKKIFWTRPKIAARRKCFFLDSPENCRPPARFRKKLIALAFLKEVWGV